MKWRPGGRSADVEDRRASGGGFGGGGMPIPIGRMGGGGIGTIVVLVIVYLLFIKGGGGGGGFDVPAPGSAFPQVPQSGDGTASVAGPGIWRPLRSARTAKVSISHHHGWCARREAPLRKKPALAGVRYDESPGSTWGGDDARDIVILRSAATKDLPR